MDTTQALESVDQSVKDLTTELHDFRKTFTAKEVLNRRTRMLTLWFCGIVALCFVGLCVSGYLIWRVNEIVEENADVAKINCLNANETRQAHRDVWTLVIKAAEQRPDRTAQDIRNSEAFQEYIDDMFVPRDCDDLERRYPLPKPPDFKF